MRAGSPAVLDQWRGGKAYPALQSLRGEVGVQNRRHTETVRLKTVGFTRRHRRHGSGSGWNGWFALALGW